MMRQTPATFASYTSRIHAWLLLFEAAAALAMAAMRVRFLPFGRTVRQRARRRESQRTEMKIAELCWAVQAASSRVPFRAKCLEQALALRSMLRRRGQASILHYGIRYSPTGLAAHAWLSANGQIVIGGATKSDFAEVATFGGDNVDE